MRSAGRRPGPRHLAHRIRRVERWWALPALIAVAVLLGGPGGPLVHVTSSPPQAPAALPSTGGHERVLAGWPANSRLPVAGPAASGPAGWTNVTASTYPGHVGDAGLAWDPTAGALVLFGGDNQTPTNATWLYYPNGTWTNVSGEIGKAPSPRWGFDYDFHYDPNFGGDLLYGGCDAGGNSLSDLWLFNGTWTDLTARYPGGPGPLQYGSGTFDAFDNYSVYFGGNPSYCSTATTSGTWTLSPQAGWQEVFPSQSPIGLRGASMAFDAADNETVLFGGRDSGGRVYNATWLYRAGVWSQSTSSQAPPPGYLAGLTYLSNDQYLLEYGGCQAGGCVLADNATWAFTNLTWINVSALPLGGGTPGPLGGGAFAYDPSTGEALLVGGTYPTGPASDAHSSGVWSYTPPPLAARFNATRTVLAPGSSITFSIDATGGSFQYRYQYGGLPSYCPSQNRPRMLCVFSVPGNYSVTGSVTDSAGASVNSSLELHVLGPFSAQMSWAPGQIDLGESANLSALVAGATPPLSYDWFELPPGCVPADRPTVHCTPSRVGSFPAEVEISDTTGRNATAWSNLTVAAPPTLALSLSGIRGDAPYPLEVQALPAAGTLPYVFDWDWGDGTVTVGGASAQHVYAAGGQFHLTAALIDNAGRWANATGTITVQPTPSVEVRTDSFFVPRCGGTPVYNLSAVASGGTLPYSFSWNFGDSSAPATGAAVQHFYVAGAHVVSLEMTDGAATKVTADLSISVPVVTACPAPSHGGGGGGLGTTTYLILLGAAIVIGFGILLAARRPPNRQRDTGRPRHESPPPPP